MHSVKLGLVAAAMLLGTTALTSPAFASGNNGGNGATQNHTCQGGNNCNTTTNNYDNDTHNTYNKGGTGYGGNAYSKAYGGDVDNHNYNDSHNKAYGGDVDNHNYNDSHNKAYGGDGGDAKAYGGDAKAYGGDAKAYGGKVEDSGNSYNDNDNESRAEVNINENHKRAPVNTAYAAGLSVGEDTCMGSSSIGAQAVSFGLSIGTTWQDDNCRRLKNSRQLVALGYHRAATSLMCVDEDVRQAMIMAGTPCPNGEAVAVYVAPPAREYVPMAPVADDRPVKRKKRVRKALPPK
jgi:hypothetical protein